MPRAARKKSEDAMYHVMSRSISEVDLFQCDEDKDYYLGLLKRYKEEYHVRIYCYALMSNHVHIYINPCGFDISSFMRSLNNAYVSYFNRKYDRHGHLYQGRFASTVVDNDTYSLTLSAYIHNNAKDIPGYFGKEELYPYSSYGIYTGHRKNTDNLVDTSFVLNMFHDNIETAQQKYKEFVHSLHDNGVIKEVDDNITIAYKQNVYNCDKRYIIRNRLPDALINLISDIMGERMDEGLRAKHNREMSKNRAFATYIMRIICGYTYKDLCNYIGNISVSGVSRLTSEGFKLIKNDERYRSTFNALIQAG